ncbi:hypothetical protein KQX54_013238 [Cotesia glomerata]|uniref:Uncharacterized protein n=1 Tax=Cotesia glomerata TaxID=32391 RepID=A0AAV7IZ00_COTGL|nr:hypothetical protein KQX54_013238 [Cotesia glomerata]
MSDPHSSILAPVFSLPPSLGAGVFLCPPVGSQGIDGPSEVFPTPRVVVCLGAKRRLKMYGESRVVKQE